MRERPLDLLRACQHSLLEHTEHTEHYQTIRRHTSHRGDVMRMRTRTTTSTALPIRVDFIPPDADVLGVRPVVGAASLVMARPVQLGAVLAHLQIGNGSNRLCPSVLSEVGEFDCPTELEIAFEQITGLPSERGSVADVFVEAIGETPVTVDVGIKLADDDAPEWILRGCRPGQTRRGSIPDLRDTDNVGRLRLRLSGPKSRVRIWSRD